MICALFYDKCSILYVYILFSFYNIYNILIIFYLYNKTSQTLQNNICIQTIFKKTIKQCVQTNNHIFHKNVGLPKLLLQYLIDTASCVIERTSKKYLKSKCSVYFIMNIA